MAHKKKILFVCVENAGRSQMAEAFFRKYASENFQVQSAGTNPSSQINPVVAQVMNEVGINLETKPKLLSSDMINNSIKTVNMGCMNKESCPALYVKGILDWSIDDPKELPIEDVRKIRDQIEHKVKELVKTLEVT